MREIRIVRELPYPPERVWAVLVDPQEMSIWLMQTDFQPILGHEFTFKTDPAPGFDGTVRCKVLAIRPPHHLRISWRGGPLETEVTFDLEPTPQGTRLTLVHSGFKGLGNLLPRIFLGLGWRKIIGKKLPGRIARQA